MANKVTCNLCEKVFSRTYNLYRHIRMVHQNHSSVEHRKLNVICTDCKSAFSRYSDFREHLKTAHNITCEVKTLVFPSLSEFYEWKAKIESETKSAYVAPRSQTTTACKAVLMYYNCHRTGMYKSSSTGKRKLKRIGSKKINGHCPSTMTVLVFKTKVWVTFYATHHGHEADIRHLPLRRQDRYEIAGKLKQGCTVQEILDDIKSSAPKEAKERRHILRKKDIYNIKRDLDLYGFNNFQHPSLSFAPFTSWGLQEKAKGLIDLLASGKIDSAKFTKMNDLLDKCYELAADEPAISEKSPVSVKMEIQPSKENMIAQQTHNSNGGIQSQPVSAKSELDASSGRRAPYIHNLIPSITVVDSVQMHSSDKEAETKKELQSSEVKSKVILPKPTDTETETNISSSKKIPSSQTVTTLIQTKSTPQHNVPLNQGIYIPVGFKLGSQLLIPVANFMNFHPGKKS